MNAPDDIVLNMRQRRFAEACAGGTTPALAARAAGYSPRSTTRLLREPAIAAAIARLRANPGVAEGGAVEGETVQGNAPGICPTEGGVSGRPSHGDPASVQGHAPCAGGHACAAAAEAGRQAEDGVPGSSAIPARMPEGFPPDAHGTASAPLKATLAEDAPVSDADAVVQEGDAASESPPREDDAISRERVLREYARLAFFDPRRLLRPDGSPRDLTELDADTAAAVAGVELTVPAARNGPPAVVRKYRLADKKAALDALARHLGLFSDEAPPDEGSLAERLARARARVGEDADDGASEADD